jgi:hypothetical protein
MRGLDPRIHLEKLIQFNKLDCRVKPDKPGNDAEIEGGRLPLVSDRIGALPRHFACT